VQHGCAEHFCFPDVPFFPVPAFFCRRIHWLFSLVHPPSVDPGAARDRPQDGAIRFISFSDTASILIVFFISLPPRGAEYSTSCSCLPSLFTPKARSNGCLLFISPVHAQENLERCCPACSTSQVFSPAPDDVLPQSPSRRLFDHRSRRLFCRRLESEMSVSFCYALFGLLDGIFHFVCLVCVGFGLFVNHPAPLSIRKFCSPTFPLIPYLPPSSLPPCSPEVTLVRSFL